MDLQTAGDHHPETILGDLLGGGGDGHHARRTLPVDGHAGGGHWQAGGDGGDSADVIAGGALRQGAAHHAILDLGRFDAGLGDGVADGVAAGHPPLVMLKAPR